MLSLAQQASWNIDEQSELFAANSDYDKVNAILDESTISGMRKKSYRQLGFLLTQLLYLKEATSQHMILHMVNKINPTLFMDM